MSTTPGAEKERLAEAAERRRLARGGRGPTVTDEAIAKIREMIVSGRWGPGDRLPREADLALQLGLSRSSLREAVRALSLVRVLEVRQGDGTYVSSLEPDLLLETTSFVAHLLRDHTVLELFEVRRLLEPAAAALAAVRMGDRVRDQLRVELDRMLVAGDVDELIEADMAFHSLIAGAAGNAVLSSLLDGLSARTMRVRVWRGRADDQALAATIAEHVRIYEAIMSRDPELTRALAAAHIATGELWLRMNLAPAAAEPPAPVP
jgi:DNA-binding FadR family transcriptional regulator